MNVRIIIAFYCEIQLDLCDVYDSRRGETTTTKNHN